MVLSEATHKALALYKELKSKARGGQQQQQQQQQAESDEPENRWDRDRRDLFMKVREQREFADVIIRCRDGVEFPAHWIILTRLGGPYFINNFVDRSQPCCVQQQNTEQLQQQSGTGGDGASQDSGDQPSFIRRRMEWSLIDSDIAEIIINYAYTGQISGLTSSNLDSFTQAVDFLQAESLLASLLSYLESSIDETNYVRYYEIARQLVSKTLLNALDKFFLDNFAQLSRSTTQINQLSADDLYRLLSDDRLDVDNELRLVNLIFRWIKRDPKNRRSQLPRLMSTVRCVGAKLLTKSQVKQYIQLKNQIKTREDDELMKEICKEYQAAIESLRNCMESHFDESGNPIFGLDDSFEMNGQSCCSRVRNRVQRSMVVIFGGWTPSGCTAGCETYDFRLDQWRPIHNFKGDAYIQSAYHGTVCLDDIVYLIGGYDGVSHFNCVRTFDPRTMTWSWKAPMSRARCYVSVVLLDGYIYALGGFDGYTRLNSVERYDPKLNQWEPVADMNLVRSDAAAATLNGKIYIVGGFTGDVILPSCEVYDPKQDIWSMIEPMNGPRSGCQLVAYHNALWVLGGNDGLQHVRLKTVERYDPESGTWQHRTQMYNDRSNFACHVFKDRIYAIGGFSSGRTTRAVEYYEEDSDQWSYAGDLCNCRSAHSVAVLNGIHFGLMMLNQCDPTNHY